MTVPLLLLLAGAVGLTIVVTLGNIAAPLRRIYPPLLSCPMCCGVWIGGASGVLYVAQPHLPGWVCTLLFVLCVAFTCSLAATAVGLAIERLAGEH